LVNNLNVNGSLTLNNDLDASEDNYSINIAGSIIPNGGWLNAREGTVNLTGTDQQVAGSLEFYQLVKQVDQADTLYFGQGSTIKINDLLELSGQENELLSLRSSKNGEQWILDLAGQANVDYLDLQDSNNIGTTIDITA